MGRLLHITLAAVALLLASATGFAIAASTASRPRRSTAVAIQASINVCVSNRTHKMYEEKRCPRGYRKLSWKRRGPAGTRGRRGVNGTAGRDGIDGTNGTDGTDATLSVGAVSTAAAASSAAVTNVGTSSAAKLNFTVPRGLNGVNGANGTNGINGAAGTVPWSTPVIINDGINYTQNSVNACPYVSSSESTVGSPATAIDFDGSTYAYIGSGCKLVYGAGNTIDDSNTPSVDPSDWTEIAAAGLDGTADAWAVIDPGVCAAGGSCTSPVLAQGGVGGESVSFTYSAVGQYQLTISGCPAADTPASGQPFPVTLHVTPEGAYPGESSNDSSVIAVSSSVRDTTSLGTSGGVGSVSAVVDLGTPDQSVIGQADPVDEPFAVTLTC